MVAKKNYDKKLPKYDLSGVLSYKPSNDNIDDFSNKRKDIKWVRVQRYQLLPFLNMRVKIQGKIKKFSFDKLLRVQEALLNSVFINERINITHLWIKSDLLSMQLLHDTITFTGVIRSYWKNGTILALGIDDIKDMKLKENDD